MLVSLSSPVGEYDLIDISPVQWENTSWMECLCSSEQNVLLILKSLSSPVEPFFMILMILSSLVGEFLLILMTNPTVQSENY